MAKKAKVAFSSENANYLSPYAEIIKHGIIVILFDVIHAAFICPNK